MAKSKIFYSIDDYFPPYRVDVGELFGKALVDYGLDVEWYMRRSQAGVSSVESFGGQKVHLPYFSDNQGSFWKAINKLAFWMCDIWQLLRCLFKPVDVIQVRDKYLAAIFGLLVARIKGLPFVYWCSYPFPEHYLELAKKATGLRRLYYGLHGRMGKLVLYRLVMPFSDHTFVQSEQMQRDIAAYGVPMKKMTPVPMGVPQRLLDWAVTHVLPVVPGRVVYLGTMALVRQLHVLIDAFAAVHLRCPSATLLMVGDGDHPHERAALEQQVAALGLNDAVRFTGFVPIEEAWFYAASATVCASPIFPSPILNCGSPTKLFEYMALGRPVVCNAHPDQTAVIGKSGAGLCVEWGSAEFAHAMIWMLEHPEAAEAMGTKGPAWVAAHRTYTIIAENVWHKYQEILHKS
ncbi:MAG: glycosyltransferase [Methylophilaceae bacterium]|nr:glycosyltransferase [Methylophilaceae bacterium]